MLNLSTVIKRCFVPTKYMPLGMINGRVLPAGNSLKTSIFREKFKQNSLKNLQNLCFKTILITKM